MKGFIREFRRINWKGTLFGSFKRTAITLALFIPLLVLGVSFAYRQYLENTPAIIYAHKLQSMTQQVNKVVPLPKDEQPLVATVTDVTILPKEKFFSYAANGDKILMYRKHKLAVLYRPSMKEVVTEAELTFSDVMPTPLPDLTPRQAVAGAATTPSPTPLPQVSPTPDPTPEVTPSGITPYHPQGKILVQPQE